jgi:hypothetical protein
MSDLNERENVAESDVNAIVMCGCGGEDGRHPCGIGGCFRYVVTDPNEIPRNRRYHYNPEGAFKDPVWIWDVGDSWCTEYTLFHQRLYGYDEKTGEWTRPKSKCSKNSLKG